MILIELIFPMVLLILGIYHGLMQVLYRSGMIHSRQFLGPDYFQGLTLHGVVNAIVFTTFFAVAFGYAIIRFYLGRPLNMKVAWLSFGLMVIGTLLAAAAILSGKATVLYTFYPPLRAHPAFYVGLVLLVVGSWIAFFNWLPPYFAWKREHPGEKVPLAVVGIFATFIVWLIATTPVAIEIIFLLIPWSYRLGRHGKCAAGANALLVLRTSARLLLAAAGLRHVLHDAAEARGRKTVLRFRRATDFSLARALLGAGRDSSSVHRTGDQQHVEIRARVLHHARGDPEFSHGVHNRRRRWSTARASGAVAACSDGGRNFPISTRIAGCSPICLPACSFLFLAESRASSTRRIISITSCTTLPGCRRISTKPSPGRFFSLTSA